MTAVDLRDGTIRWQTGPVDQPVRLIADGADRRFLVASGSGTLSAYASEKGTLYWQVPITIGVHALALDEPLHRLVVTSINELSGDNQASVLDSRTGQTLAQFEVGKYPAAVAVDSFRHHAFVANFVDNSVSSIDLQRLTMGTTVVLGPEPGTVAALAVDLHADRVVTMSYPPRIAGTTPQDGQVNLLASPNGSVLKRMSLPNPIALAASPALGVAVIGFSEDNRGQVVALGTSDSHIVWTTTLPSVPKALGIWDRGARVAVAVANNAILVLEAQTGHLLCQWALSAQPTALALDETTGIVVVGTADGHLVAQSLRCQ